MRVSSAQRGCVVPGCLTLHAVGFAWATLGWEPWGDMTVLYSAEAGLSLLPPPYVCVFVIWLSRVCVLAVDRESECAVATRVRRRDEHHAVCESQSRGRL